MIITFITEGFNTVSEDYSVIYDNCTELRTKPLDTMEKFKKSKEVLEQLQNSSDHAVKYWCENANQTEDEISYFLSKSYLLQFQSNGKHYYVITRTKVCIANDENKTFKILN